jgi:hypothetical protein
MGTPVAEGKGKEGKGGEGREGKHGMGWRDVAYAPALLQRALYDQPCCISGREPRIFEAVAHRLAYLF